MAIRRRRSHLAEDRAYRRILISPLFRTMKRRAARARGASGAVYHPFRRTGREVALAEDPSIYRRPNRIRRNHPPVVVPDERGDLRFQGRLLTPWEGRSRAVAGWHRVDLQEPQGEPAGAAPAWDVSADPTCGMRRSRPAWGLPPLTCAGIEMFQSNNIHVLGRIEPWPVKEPASIRPCPSGCARSNVEQRASGRDRAALSGGGRPHLAGRVVLGWRSGDGE
jgi:hypothetical protein